MLLPRMHNGGADLHEMFVKNQRKGRPQPVPLMDVPADILATNAAPRPPPPPPPVRTKHATAL